MSSIVHKQSTVEEGDSSALHAGYVSVAEIQIDAPARAVWPHVINIGSWIYDFHFEHIAGDRNGEGEVKYFWPAGAEFPTGTVTVAQKDRTAENATVLKTLKAIPGKLWYGINPPKIDAGIRSTGVNLVLLNEREGKTLVTAIRSKEALCPTHAIRDATQADMTKLQPIAQMRWMKKYLPRLKALAEGSHSLR